MFWLFASVLGRYRVFGQNRKKKITPADLTSKVQKVFVTDNFFFRYSVAQRNEIYCGQSIPLKPPSENKIKINLNNTER